MPTPLSDIGKMRELSEEEKKRINRIRFFEGGEAAELEKKYREKEKERQAGLTAISQSSGSQFQDPMALSDEDKSKVQRTRFWQGTIPALNREESIKQDNLKKASLNMLSGIGSQDEGNQMPTDQGQNYDTTRSQLFRLGLAEQPEVKAYLAEQERIKGIQSKQADIEKTKEQIETLADQLPEEYNVLRATLRTIVRSGTIEGVLADVLKNISEGGQGDVDLKQGIEKEGVLQQNRMDLENLKFEHDKALKGIEQSMRTQNEKNEKEKPLFKQFGANEKEQINDINKSFLLLDNVLGKIDKLDEGKIKGFITQLKKDKRVFTDPETQELATAYTMLTQSLMKQIQGSRPSDYDAIIFQTATGEKSYSKENMKAALKSIGSYAAANAGTFKNNMSKGYEVEPQRIEELFHPTANKYIKTGSFSDEETHKISSDDEYDKLPSGTEFIGPDGVKRRKP